MRHLDSFDHWLSFSIAMSCLIGSPSIISLESDSTDENTEFLDEPLYSCAKLSVIDSYMKIIKYSLRLRLTKQALGDPLSLLDEHLR